MTSHKSSLLVLVLLCVMIKNGHSSEMSSGKHDHHHKAKEAHVHGTANLNIVLAGSLLQIELVSPALNLVGFEHKASNQREKDKVLKTEELLRQHRSMFLFTNKTCIFSDVSIDLGTLIAPEEQAQSETIHSEIIALYQYRCGLEPLMITVRLFEEFPDLVKIHTRWVSQTAQGSIVLTKERHIMEFSKQL